MGALPWPIIFSIIVSAGLLKIFGGLSPNKLNIAQAGGSIGGLMAAAVVFTLPGFVMDMPDSFPLGWIALISVCGAVLGIGLSIPLREEYVIKQNLAFPAGRVGGEIIQSGFSQDHRFGLMLIFGFLTALLTIGRESLNWNFINLGTVGSQPILILIMPMVIATGLILGPENSFSWGAGGFLSVIIGAIIMIMLPKNDAIPLIQNFGMGLVIGSGIGYILMHTGVSFQKNAIFIRHKPWVWVMVATSVFILMMTGIPVFAAIFCLLLTFLSVNLASRMTGLTNIDPLEQFGLLSALFITVFFGVMNLNISLEHRYMITFFIATATAIAGDIGHDYKSAEIVGTDYHQIIKIDLIVAVVISLMVPALLLFIKSPVIAHQLFTPDLPAPQAQIVMANLKGLPHPIIFLIGLFMAIIIEGCRAKGRFLSIHLMPLGIGLFLGFNLAFLITIGGFAALHIQKRGSEKMLTAIVIAAAILSGEGTIGFLQSAVNVFSPDNYTAIMGITTLILIAFLARSIRSYFQEP